jgi:hypothetical protein
MLNMGRYAGLGIGVLGIIAACGGSQPSSGTGGDASTCAVGEERCPCTTGGACNAGLTCASTICVRLGAGSEASVPSPGIDATLGDDQGAGNDASGSDASGDATIDSTVDAPGDSDGPPGDAPSFPDDVADTGPTGPTAEGGPNPCSGWGCHVTSSCEGGGTTTLSGKVFDPAGKNPLFNVWVFVPNDASTLPAITQGTNTCNTCDVPVGHYVTATATDASGSFTLTGVPTGTGVPVVVQIGKWRRTVPVDITNDCQPNSVADGVLRLPRRRNEGDMPQMALLTGGCDDLGCFLLNVGIDASEFSAPHAGGRLDVYTGTGVAGTNGAGLSSGTAGDCTTSSCPLWSSKSALEAYDLVALSCECGESNATKPAAAMQVLHDWLGEGGKVFAEHFQYTWFKNSPATDFQNVATWLGSSTAGGAGTYDLNVSFAKGEAYRQWLYAGSDAGTNTVALSGVGNSVSSVSSAATRWIYDPGTSDTKYTSFTTPVGSTCGRVGFTDLHTSSSLLATATSIPSSCTAANLTPQEKAVEFLFFDLSACVAPDQASPPLPPPSGP